MAMKMGLKLKDREIDQVDTADEILLERDWKDERMDNGWKSGQETERGQWADEMSDEVETPNNRDWIRDALTGDKIEG